MANAVPPPQMPLEDSVPTATAADLEDQIATLRHAVEALAGTVQRTQGHSATVNAAFCRLITEQNLCQAQQLLLLPSGP